MPDDPRMVPGTRRDIDVQVQVDGTWYDGNLEHWRQNAEGRWEAWVRWTTGPGQNYIGWYDQDDIRQV